MKGLATNKLRSFNEAALGHEIRIFGNVAVAVAVCQMTIRVDRCLPSPGGLTAIKDV
jgi:hypothetical protein